MFFIGLSTNVFAYLLVSAFFVICFYSKSEAKIPEALPGYVNIVDIRTFTRDIYFNKYQLAEDSVLEEKKEQTFLKGSDQSRSKTHLYFMEYEDPNLRLKSLRAPPIA